MIKMKGSLERGPFEILITEFAENYMQKLFFFCLKKTGNNSEAEELTQDVAVNVLDILQK